MHGFRQEFPPYKVKIFHCLSLAASAQYHDNIGYPLCIDLDKNFCLTNSSVSLLPRSHQFHYQRIHLQHTLARQNITCVEIYVFSTVCTDDIFFGGKDDWPWKYSYFPYSSKEIKLRVVMPQLHLIFSYYGVSLNSCTKLRFI